MKEKIAAVLVLLIALISFGCVDGKEFKAEPVALAKKAAEAPPVPLNQIISGNDAALAFAGQRYDALGNDKYLGYVVDAKDRDAEAQAKAAALALQLDVIQAESQLTGGSQSSSSDTGQSSSGSGSSSSGGTSGSSGEGSTGGSSGSSERYVNSELGYSIEFPSGWAQADTAFADFQLVAAVSPPSGGGDQFLENLGVAVQDLPLELSSGEYLEMAILGLEASMTDFVEVSRSDFTFDGRAGKKLVFTYTLDGTPMKDAFYEVVKGTKAYVIVATAEASAYGEYEDKFDASAASFLFETVE